MKKALRTYLIFSILSFPVSVISIPDAFAENLTHAQCTDLPSQQSTMSQEEFKKRTDWCNKMDGEATGKASAGKDSSAITTTGDSNVNAPIRDKNP